MRDAAASGRLIAFVGPSGVGKDSVMSAVAQRAELRLVRRVITRPTEAGGEDFDGVSEAAFYLKQAAGHFAISWEAHGLHYGIPKAELEPLTHGEDLIINLSRAVLAEMQRDWPLVVFSLTAPMEVLAQRLAQRGRESEEEIARRLERAAKPMPEGVDYTEIDNGGALEDSVEAVLAALYPAS